MVKYCYAEGIRKNGSTTRVSFAFIEGEDNRVTYAVAIQHPKDEFTRKIGRKIARGRLESHLKNTMKGVDFSGYSVFVPEDTNLYGIKQYLIKDFNNRGLQDIYLMR